MSQGVRAEVGMWLQQGAAAAVDSCSDQQLSSSDVAVQLWSRAPAVVRTARRCRAAVHGRKSGQAARRPAVRHVHRVQQAPSRSWLAPYSGERACSAADSSCSSWCRGRPPPARTQNARLPRCDTHRCCIKPAPPPFPLAAERPGGGCAEVAQADQGAQEPLQAAAWRQEVGQQEELSNILRSAPRTLPVTHRLRAAWRACTARDEGAQRREGQAAASVYKRLWWQHGWSAAPGMAAAATTKLPPLGMLAAHCQYTAQQHSMQQRWLGAIT